MVEPIGTLTLETAKSVYLWDQGHRTLEECFDLIVASGDIEMTVENRGTVVLLGRRERLVWTQPNGDVQTWYGAYTSTVELRVWHDGSVTVEREADR